MKSLSLSRCIPLVLLAASAVSAAFALGVPAARAQEAPPAPVVQPALPAAAPQIPAVDTISINSSFARAVKAHEAGDMAAALTEMQNAVSDEPESASANAWLGYLLVLQKEPEKAVPYLEKAIKLNPALPDPYTNLGSALLSKPSHGTEETDRALQLLQKAVELSTPTTAGAAYHNYGFALARTGRYPEAVDAYKKSLDLRPNNASTYSNMGFALQRSGKIDEALESLKSGTQYAPEDPAAWTLLGLAQAQVVSPPAPGKPAQVKDAPGAINSLETALKLQPANYPAQATLALMYALVGRSADAAQAYSTAAMMAEVDKKPELGVLYYNEGVVLAKQEKYAQASLVYQKALEINPGYYDALVNDGFALIKLNKTNDAIARFRAAADVAKTPAQQKFVWSSLAAAYQRKNEPANASMAWRKVSALDPSDTTAKYYASAHAVDYGNAADAVSYYRDLVHTQPQTAENWLQLGMAYQRLGKPDAAFNAFQFALKRQPGNAIAHNNVGVIYERRGNRTEAVREYKKALATDPKMQEARFNLARFAPSGLLTPKTNPLPKFAAPTNYRTL